MKKNIKLQLIIIVLLLSSNVKSQCHYFGFKAGAVAQKMASNEFPNSYGLSLGGYYQFGFSDKLKYRINLDYSKVGAKKYRINDIEFDGGYLGYADLFIDNSSITTSFSFSFPVTKILDIEVPVRFGYRGISYKREYGFNQNQLSDTNDLVDGYVADKANVNNIFKNKSWGYGTGVTFNFLPNKMFSPYLSLNIDFYKPITHYKINEASLMVNNEIAIPTVNIPSNQYTIKIGVKINLNSCIAKSGSSDSLEEDRPDRSRSKGVILTPSKKTPKPIKGK